MCTFKKHGNLFILTLTGDQEHRLNPTLISSIQSALTQVRSQAFDGSVLITKSQGKFFSNGFDLNHAKALGAKVGSPKAAMAELIKMGEMFKGLIADLISLPMPTVVAVNVHAAAAGMIFAISHDYIVMTSSKGVMYMSELDIGMSPPDYMTALIRDKIGSPMVRRDVLLQAKKVKGEAAVAMGFIDLVHGSTEKTVAATAQLAEELGKKKWKGQVYGEIRKSMYPEVCGILGLKSGLVLVSKLSQILEVLLWCL